MKRALLFISLPVALSLAVSRGKTDTASKEKKDRIYCLVEDLDADLSKCNNGDILAFFPPSWGNEQYPLYAVLLFCDLDKTIVHTRGGVICKFDKAKWQRFVELSKKNQQQNQQEGGK
ncbi:MAG: hypothetical protein LM570_03460 [Thermocrinis sp.]|nr:hypothetical protein [Thermocrinis sp.]